MGNLSVSFDVNVAPLQDKTPVSIPSFEIPSEHCACDDCNVEFDSPGMDIPVDPVPVPIPVYPTAVIALSPLSAPQGLPKEYNFVITYTRNNGGLPVSAIIKINGAIVYSGTPLIGSFTTTLFINGAVTAEVIYAPGDPLYDANGTQFPGLPGGTVTTNSSIIQVSTGIFVGTTATIAPTLTASNAVVGSPVELNTGATHKKFWVAIPIGKVLLSVLDSSAMFVEVKDLFTLTATQTVSGILHNIYYMENAIPYSVSHKFEFYVS